MLECENPGRNHHLLAGRIAERRLVFRLLLFALLVTPVLAAVWYVPWFVTIDGPAHTYNAYILKELLKPVSHLAQFYGVRSLLLPNVAGHLVLLGLMSIVSAQMADRIMMVLTFVGFASSVIWLRRKVMGDAVIELGIVLGCTLALNWMWLMGFYNFLLGACFFSITLGLWWISREKMKLRHAVLMASLLVVIYLCHPVTLGATLLGLTILVLFTRSGDWYTRALWTSVSFLPLVPLALYYRSWMNSGSTLHVRWMVGVSPSIREVVRHVIAADPIRLTEPRSLPFAQHTSTWFLLITPVIWIVVGLSVLFVFGVTWSRRQPNTVQLKPWVILALVLLIFGLLGPDDMGEENGTVLRERMLLLTFMTLVPVLKVDLRRAAAKIGIALLVIGEVLQVAAIWDYALTSNRMAQAFVQARPYVGTGRRVKTLLIGHAGDYELGGHFRGLPVNVPDLLGIETENVVWDNYEAFFYFFPVRYRDADTERDAARLVNMTLLVAPGSITPATETLTEWSRLLDETHERIDILVIWGSDPRLDAIDTKWFDATPLFASANIRVFQHR